LLIHVLQHVSFEGPAAVAKWAGTRGHDLAVSSLWKGETLAAGVSPDWLLILGGPMGAGDEDRFPWLIDEKRLIERALRSDKVVLGICLGAQLLAEVLGARITGNEHREIGWFPVQRTDGCESLEIAKVFPEAFGAFHWHGDTFSIPSGARCIGRSEACENQAFVYSDRVLALQFHLEVTLASTLELIAHSSSDLDEGGRFVQRAGSMLSDPRRFEMANALLFRVLDQMAKRCNPDGRTGCRGTADLPEESDILRRNLG